MEKEVFISDITGEEIPEGDPRYIVEIKRISQDGSIDERFGVRILDASEEDIKSAGWHEKGRRYSVKGRRGKKLTAA